MNNLVIKKCSVCGATVMNLSNCDSVECNIACCGQNMNLVIPNSVDCSIEKHVPTYEKVEDEIFVKINHVMEKEHYIEWIAMVTDNKTEFVRLFPEQNAEARFKYVSGATLYAYCNKHGLWTSKVD